MRKPTEPIWINKIAKYCLDRFNLPRLNSFCLSLLWTEREGCILSSEKKSAIEAWLLSRTVYGPMVKGKFPQDETCHAVTLYILGSAHAGDSPNYHMHTRWKI